MQRFSVHTDEKRGSPFDNIHVIKRDSHFLNYDCKQPPTNEKKMRTLRENRQLPEKSEMPSKVWKFRES